MGDIYYTPRRPLIYRAYKQAHTTNWLILKRTLHICGKTPAINVADGVQHITWNVLNMKL